MAVGETREARLWPPSAWGSYRPEGARDLRLDFLRGFAVLAMVVDHIGGPSWLYAVTGGNRFYTSAAEGFIFLSGLLGGLVYERIAAREGVERAMSRALERAGVLYLLTIGVTVPLLVASELMGLPWATDVSLADPLTLVLGVFTLHRTYYLIDVMVLYTLLLTLAPVALYLLARGQARLLLAASWGLWLAFQLAPDELEVPWQIAGNHLFHFPAWQVLFFTAMVLGYYRERVATWLSSRAQCLLFVLSGLGFAALLVLYGLGDSAWRWLPVNSQTLTAPESLSVLLFGKADVRPGRLVAAIVVFGFLFLLVTHAWRPLQRSLGWLLLPLGQNALYAYTAHIVLVLLLGIALLPFGSIGHEVPWLNTLLQIGSVLLIWVLVRGRVLFPSSGARLRWSLVPPSLTVAALLVLPLDRSTLLPGGEGPTEAATSPRRAANPFGTPIPRTGAGAAATALLAVQPAPIPVQPEKRRPPGGTNHLPEYVGPIRGRFLELTFDSRALGREMSYFLYLPPDYDDPQRVYPVLYLLHGASGAFEEWPALGLVDRLDRAIQAGALEPFIVVVPQGDFGCWLNHAREGPRWGDYVTRDLVAHIDATYRTLRQPYHRAIGGLSTGATGALVQAFTHPEVFAVVGAHSPTLRERTGRVCVTGEGEEFAVRDPISLVRSAAGLNDLWIWIDIGADDDWYPRAAALHAALVERGIEHEWRVWPGDHDLEYTSAHIPDYLRFYSDALREP